MAFSFWLTLELSYSVYQQLVEPGWLHCRLCGSQRWRRRGHGSPELETYVQNLRHVAEELTQWVRSMSGFPGMLSKTTSSVLRVTPSPGACPFLQMYGACLVHNDFPQAEWRNAITQKESAIQLTFKIMRSILFILNPLCVFVKILQLNNHNTWVISGAQTRRANVLLH